MSGDKQDNMSGNIDMINRLFASGLKRSLIAFTLIFAVILAIEYLFGIKGLVMPGLTCFLFTAIFCSLSLVIWKRVATNNRDMMTTLLTAVSGFRLLLSLATMGIYYMLTSRDDMKVFLLIFAVYYLALTIIQTSFFRKALNDDN